MHRAIGTALTRSTDKDRLLPGFQSIYPFNGGEALHWAPYLYWLELLPANRVVAPGWERLRDIVDLGEAQALFHFPYPPEAGVPGVSFLSALESAEIGSKSLE
jgi:hypothetical protein